MKQGNTISFIGSGNMAGALMSGLLSSGTYNPEQIMASDLRADRLKELEKSYKIQTTSDNRTAATFGDVVVLSTKPQNFPELLPEIARRIRAESVVLSIAAGVPIAAIEAHLQPGTRIVRAMPNTPALVRTGATGLAKGSYATPEDLERAEAIFKSVGITISVDESLLDAVTGLSGSGPAYVFAFIEALQQAGNAMGLNVQDARALITQTILGSVKLLMETGKEPASLREMVTSPNGTTAAGLKALAAAGFSQAIDSAIRSATHRSKELGDESVRKLAKKSP
jgi:pyrroline-5-carboxylate reductase